MAWYFTQAADIFYEVRATGILSTQPIDLELSGTKHPYGTVVHPGVLAGYHQHFFSLRIDPMLAGRGNLIVYDEAVPLPRNQKINPHGVGYTVQTTTLRRSGGYEMATERNRIFRITNPAVVNRVNGSPVSYKIQVPPMQPILADTHSFHSRRAQFADRSIYVTKYQDGELFAAGRYTNQSRGVDGVRKYAARKDDLEASGDPVVWISFGMNHVPRTEEFPVMPAETMRVGFRPFNFFSRNPAIDVPPARQEVSCSVSLNEMSTKKEHKGRDLKCKTHFQRNDSGRGFCSTECI